MSILLSGLSLLWCSMGLVTRSPYCGDSSNTWRGIASSDGRWRAVKGRLGIGGTAKKWALIGGWRPPGVGRRLDEVGPLMRELREGGQEPAVQELRKGGQVSERPVEMGMEKHAPALDTKQELINDKTHIGWEDNQPMPGFFVNQDLDTSADRPLPKIVTFGGIGTLFRQKDPMSVLLRTELLRAHPGIRLPGVALFDREIKNVYKQHNAIRPNYGATCGMPACEWWYNVLWEATSSVMKGFRYPMIDGGVFSEVVDKLYFETGAGSGQWELIPGAAIVLERLADWRDNGNGPLLGCISNIDERLITILHNLGIAHHMDFVLSGRETGDPLPSTCMFNEALGRAEVETSQSCLHVGADTHLDYFAALNAGWQAIKIGLVDYEDLKDVPAKGYKSNIFDIRFLPENLGLDEEKPDLNLDAPREGVHNGEYWDPVLHFDDANWPDVTKV